MCAFNFTMSLLLCVVLLYIQSVYASLLSLNCTCIHTLDSNGSPPSCDTRTLTDILWSCAVTLFACTWTAVHPNIPSMDNGKFAVTFWRLCIMVVALLAPELMITWAAQQLLSALRAAKDFNTEFNRKLVRTRRDRRAIWGSTLAAALLGGIHIPGSRPSAGWTVTHGFFVWMGGFMLHIDGEPRATLTSDELLRLIREGSVEMPIIAGADIEDRSKGDVLSKGVAVFQLLWFVLQLAARYVQNLQITLLEIDTLAVTVMTCIAYFLWWKKPKDVGRPYTVHLRSALPRDLRLTYDKAHLDGSNAGQTSLFTYVMHPFIRLMGTEEIAPLPARSWHVPSIGGYGDYLRVPIGCLGGIVFGGYIV
ncbi:hypothetical protein EDB19DRAFT_2044234 [Suillus lakei]|nr:hypothetical protein EDB19DRAFT_2044234 [Suillus lakei]